MRKIALIGIILPFLVVSCTKEDGELFDNSATSPAYSNSILEEVWSTQLEFLPGESDYLRGSLVVEDLLLLSTYRSLVAFSLQSGEQLWTFEKPFEFVLGIEKDATIIGDQIYFIDKSNCRSGILVLDKNTGQLKDNVILHELPGVEGFCLVAYRAGNKVYFTTEKANVAPGDIHNRSFFINRYDLQSENVHQLYHNDLTFSNSIKLMPVMNEDQQRLYLHYTTSDSGKYFVHLVEVLLSGDEAELVFSEQMEEQSNSRINWEPFAVKDQHLIANFDRGNSYSIKGYDLSNEGEVIWKQPRLPGGLFSGSTTSYIPHMHMGELYLRSDNNFEKREYQTGATIYSEYLFGYRKRSIGFLPDQPIGFATQSGNAEKLALFDLQTGNFLVVLDLEKIGVDADYFINSASTYDNGKKLVVSTSEGRVVSFDLPF
ncbi:MAG: hypothetical protein EA411_12610 [Saprospirales bacterium]|nr:MAG: hypothetical protein EA411_12610 [Saprospirales bacterium]